MQNWAQNFVVTKQGVKEYSRQQKKTEKEQRTNRNERQEEKNDCCSKQMTQKTVIHLPSSRGFQTVSRAVPTPFGP